MMPHKSPSAGPEPGWYAESARSTRLRWWDGTAWTAHYRVIDAPVDAPAPTDPPATRAERRAAQKADLASAESTDRVVFAGARFSSPAPTEPMTAVADPEPVTPGPQQPVPPEYVSPAAPEPPASSGVPASEPEPAAASPALTEAETDYIPDNVLPRSAHADRIPPPVVAYQPQNVSRIPSASGPLPMSVVPSRRNGPTRASLVLTVVGAVGAAAAHWLLADRDPLLAGLASALSVALLLLAVGLAIGGITVAVRRSISLVLPIIVLLLSLAALAFAALIAAMQVLDVTVPFLDVELPFL